MVLAVTEKNPENVRRGRNSKARGKSVERQVAERVEGKRIPDGVGYGDVQTVTSVYEVKSWQRPTPQWLQRAWAQALQAAAETGKDPNVVLSTVDGNKRSYWLIRPL